MWFHERERERSFMRERNDDDDDMFQTERIFGVDV